MTAEDEVLKIGKKLDKMIAKKEVCSILVNNNCLGSVSLAKCVQVKRKCLNIQFYLFVVNFITCLSVCFLFRIKVKR